MIFNFFSSFSSIKCGIKRFFKVNLVQFLVLRDF